MVLCFTILYLGFNYLKGIDFFTTSNKYYAIYKNVDGLNVSNPVLINGFAVGRVSSIKLLQGSRNRILVELDIDGDIVLGDSAVAKLNSDFLGNKSILLGTGNISKPLEVGDTLRAVLDRGIVDLLTESAEPVADNLQATIKKLNSILDEFEGNGAKINEMVEHLSKTPKILNATIVDVNGQLRQITSKFAEIELNLQKSLEGTQPMMQNLTQFTDSLKNLEINKTIQQTQKTIESLNAAVDQFSNNKGTLGKLINDDSLYVNLNRTVKDLDQLLIHFDNNPKHFLGPLGKSPKKIERDRRKAAAKAAESN